MGDADLVGSDWYLATRSENEGVRNVSERADVRLRGGFHAGSADSDSELEQRGNPDIDGTGEE